MARGCEECGCVILCHCLPRDRLNEACTMCMSFSFTFFLHLLLAFTIPSSQTLIFLLFLLVRSFHLSHPYDHTTCCVMKGSNESGSLLSFFLLPSSHHSFIHFHNHSVTLIFPLMSSPVSLIHLFFLHPESPLVQRPSSLVLCPRSPRAAPLSWRWFMLTLLTFSLVTGPQVQRRFVSPEKAPGNLFSLFPSGSLATHEGKGESWNALRVKWGKCVLMNP